MELGSGPRLVELETLLRRHSAGLTSSELATFLNVDVSTIRRDLAHLSSTGVIIQKRRRRYHIGFHGASHALRLTTNEVFALYFACRLLSRRQRDRNLHVATALQKLAGEIREQAPRLASYIEDTALQQLSGFLNEAYRTVLETMTQAWSEGRVVNLCYQDRDGTLTSRRFHPFCIEPYGATNSCYTIGFDELRETIRTLKLERIVTADLTDDHFDIPIEFGPHRLFSEAWGVVWRETPPQKVELRFFGEAAQSIREAYWHPSQQITPEQDGTCHVTFHVSEPREMMAWVLQWGASVEVLSPPELRSIVIAETVETAERYLGEQSDLSARLTRKSPLGEKKEDGMTGYLNYYLRTIRDYTHGIKLVSGPTGLGKSSGIPDVVWNTPERKFIYIANRKQLLDEMATRFQPSECVVLRRDLEVVQQILMTQRTAFENLLSDSRFVTALKQARQKYHLKSLEVVAIRRACQQLLEMTANNRILPRWMSEQADAQARTVLLAVRWALKMTRDAKGQGKVYTWLANHPIVEALFPALPFCRRPEVRIMLLTLQKAYYGFFDGIKTRSFLNLFEEDPPIIFLDEFDFLENDLVRIICRTPQITDPFDFVAHFYRPMARHKLPKEDFPLHLDTRARIEYIVNMIEGEDGVQRKGGLKYPEINHFTLDKSSVRKDWQQTTPAVFRTQHVISTNPLYVNQTARSFQLENHAHPDWVSATWFFNIIGKATTQILSLFKDLERSEEVLYWEMMRQCFRNTDFFEEILAIAHLPHYQQPQRTLRGHLLSSGFNVFDIDDLHQRTDNEEVEVRFYQMLQTPENVLCSLAQHSLVFGLSATAELERCIHHFDLDWLRKEGLSHDTTDDDRADIQRMKAEKAEKRVSKMRVSQIDSLDMSDPFQERLARFLEAVARNDEFSDDANSHRSQRLHRFFTSLLWIGTHGGNRPRQLLFFNSFQQIKLLFTVFASHAKEAGIYEAEPLPDTPWFHTFTIVLNNQRATIVFFNAELSTQVRLNKEAERAFTRLFWTPDPVIVVTQYLSAGNGVNLYYTNEEDGADQDFTHIGLLEAPYYFFTKPDPFEMDLHDVLAGRKENIWYQAKLFYAKLISHARFQQVLSTINRPGKWNGEYAQGSTARDCLYNKLAIFIQALGRVERVWHETPAQVALLSPDVFQVFQAFVGEEHETVREKLFPYLSTNMQAVLEDVALRTSQLEREARRRRDTRLQASNHRSQEAIQELVRRLETVRSQRTDLEARYDWEALRQAVLHHDFHAEIVQRYHCVASSPYFSRGKVNITPELDLLPLNLHIPGSRIISFNAMYKIISENPVICEYFLEHGYELQFEHAASSFFFTPYCLQAILAGAIGEEAITALLAEEGIFVEPLPDALFECADLRVRETCWFIDCKNYSDHTLERFSLPLDDPFWHPSLNTPHFVQRAKAKLEHIRREVTPESKLIYINLVSGQERLLRYYSPEFQEVFHFEKAAIIVVQGALDGSASNCYHAAFNTFLADIKKALRQQKEKQE